MTNRNNAAQADRPQTVLSFDERERILCQFMGEPIHHDRKMAIAIETAVLSKLRAPVADERALPPLPEHFYSWYWCTAPEDRQRPLMHGEDAPQASEAVRDDVIEQIAALIGGHTWGDASEEFSRLIARHIRKLKSQSAALSAQPAKKPATPRAAPAPKPRQQCVCRLAETGNAHNDGGAVYE